MSDLIERLRADSWKATHKAAADEIERLTAENERLTAENERLLAEGTLKDEALRVAVDDARIMRAALENVDRWFTLFTKATSRKVCSDIYFGRMDDD